jgi:hypothetical protein
MLLTLAQWIHSTAFSAVLAGSTWAYPVIGGLHVVGIAWFGGAVLLSALRPRNENMRPHPGILWMGGTLMLLTGALLFATEPLLCAGSHSFRVKVLLLAALAVTSKVRSKIATPLTLTIWAGVLLASRGIAFF